jgi:hypothetical protein
MFMLLLHIFERKEDCRNVIFQWSVPLGFKIRISECTSFNSPHCDSGIACANPICSYYNHSVLSHLSMCTILLTIWSLSDKLGILSGDKVIFNSPNFITEG